MAKRKDKLSRKTPPKATVGRRMLPLDEQVGDQLQYEPLDRQTHLSPPPTQTARAAGHG